jgi:hypothetical protein
MSSRGICRVFSRSLCSPMVMTIAASGTWPRATPPDAPEPAADVHGPRWSVSGICREGDVRWLCPCYSSGIVHDAYGREESPMEQVLPKPPVKKAWTHDVEDVIAHIQRGRDEADRELRPRLP